MFSTNSFLMKSPAMKELSQSEEFLNATEKKVNKARMKDQYIISRALAFYLWLSGDLDEVNGMEPIEYKSDIDDFLAKVMIAINDYLDESVIQNATTKFLLAMERIHRILGTDAFRFMPKEHGKRRPINMLLFEVLAYLFTFDDVENDDMKSVSDELQEVYLDFKEKPDFDRDIIIKLLKYFKDPFVTNTAQYKRIGREPSKAIHQQLRSGGYTSQTLEELASAKTDYKIILSLDKDTYPYVNINGDSIENNLSGCFYRGETRSKAIQHIKAICGKAEEICLYDKYIAKRGTERANQENLRLITSILPHKMLNIIYQNEHLEEEDVSFLQGICTRWTL